MGEILLYTKEGNIVHCSLLIALCSLLSAQPPLESSNGFWFAYYFGDFEGAGGTFVVREGDPEGPEELAVFAAEVFDGFD